MRREIPRSPRTLRKNGAPELRVTPLTLWDRVLKSGPFVVSLTGLFVSVTAMLITLAVNGPAFLKNAKDFVEWFHTDQDFSGRWHNSREGDIEPLAWSTDEDDAVFFDVKAYRGEISGTAVSQRLCEYSLHSDVFVEGKLAGNEGVLLLWDYVLGERRAFAKAKFHVNRAQGVLDIDVSEQAPDLFPKRFRLGKIGGSMEVDNGDVDNLKESERGGI